MSSWSFDRKYNRGRSVPPFSGNTRGGNVNQFLDAPNNIPVSLPKPENTKSLISGIPIGAITNPGSLVGWASEIADRGKDAADAAGDIWDFIKNLVGKAINLIELIVKMLTFLLDYGPALILAYLGILALGAIK